MVGVWDGLPILAVPIAAVPTSSWVVGHCWEGEGFVHILPLGYGVEDRRLELVFWEADFTTVPKEPTELAVL